MISEWIAPAFLVAIFSICAVTNAVLFVRRELLKRANAPSLIPFVGGLLGLWGFSLAPTALLSRHAWVPLLADFGTVPWLIYALWKFRRERRHLRE
jgi:hypothetical protein